MTKFSATLTALTLALAPAAFADAPKEFTVDFEYDGTLLVDDAGAETVLASLELQAKDACRYISATSLSLSVDRKCVKSAVAQATTKIVAEREAAGLETADAFVREATIQVASLEQH